MAKRPHSHHRVIASPDQARQHHSRWRVAALIGLIVLASVVAYFPSLDGGFIWDDESLITDNRLIKRPGGLHEIWFSMEPIDYWPVTNTSFWIEWRLWGNDPTGYHVTNLVLHIASALLIWLILARLKIPGGWLGALLFAVHPVNVESVAWIAQRKNTLSMFFFLLSILWYIHDEQSSRHGASGGKEQRPAELAGTTRWYWLSLVAFLLAMLSKGSVAILPLVLLGIAWWERGRIAKGDLIRAAPFFAVAVVFTLVNVWFQHRGTGVIIRNATLLERVLGAAAVVWFYLYKALLPVDLAFIYPQWTVRSTAAVWWIALLAAVAVTALLLWKRHNRLVRPLLAAWAFYCVALLPVMGFADIYFMRYSLVADHYQYVAIIAVVVLVAAGWSLWYSRSSAGHRWLAISAATLVASSLTFLSWQQSKLYNDAIALYEDNLLKNSDSALVHGNLALRYMNAGDRDRAVRHCLRALEIDPQYPHAHYYLGCALMDEGKMQEAIDHFRAGLRVRPDATAESNLGSALSFTGNLPEAIEHLNRAVELDPYFWTARFNLGNVLLRFGQPQQAIPEFEETIRLRPEYIQARRQLATAFMRVGQHGKAAEQLEAFLRSKPDDPEVIYELGTSLIAANRPREAVARLQRSLNLKPDNFRAELCLGIALVRMGQLADAVAHFESAIRLEPKCVDAYGNLASAQARLNHPELAIANAEKGIAVALETDQTKIGEQLQSWLDGYRVALQRLQQGAPQSEPVSPMSP